MHGDRVRSYINIDERIRISMRPKLKESIKPSVQNKVVLHIYDTFDRQMLRSLVRFGNHFSRVLARQPDLLKVY